MSPEQLEFNLSQYLDGTLPDEQVAGVEAALASDVRAQALRDEHERLTALLRARPLPAMDWDELAKDLCAVVTGTVEDASREGDRKLNVMLRDLPPLPEMDWGRVTRRISGAVEAEIERVDARDEQIETMLRAAPLPAVDWDRLAERISSGIAAEAESECKADKTPTAVKRHEVEERPAVIGRIGFARNVRRFAIAACMLLATGLGIRMYMNKPVAGPLGTGTNGTEVVAVNTTPQTVIETPIVEIARQPAVAEISIGPSKAYAENTDADLYRRGIGNRSQVVIATPAAAAVPSDDDANALGIE